MVKFLVFLCPPMGILVHGRIVHFLINAAIWSYGVKSFSVLGWFMVLGATFHALHIVKAAQRAGAIQEHTYKFY
jgi:hypothetical protein